MALQQSFPGFWSFPDLQLGDHLCLPVRGDGERLRGTAGFADVGLRSGGKVVVFTVTETPDEMAAFLAARVPGAGAALAVGQLVVRACLDFYLAGGAFDPATVVARYATEIDLAEEQGYLGLWAAVDMEWVRADLAAEGLLPDFEASANPAFAGRRATAACIYDRTKFCPTLLETVCGAHPLTPGQAPLRFAWTTDPPGLRLSGEADLTNHRALTPLLDALHAMPGHITIDATELRFADLRAVDLLFGVTSARAMGSTTITGSTMVNRVLTLAAGCRSTTGGPPDV